MESSFLEDVFLREVDQSKVNALVGSLESQLTSSGGAQVLRENIKTVTAVNLVANSPLVLQQAASARSSSVNSVTPNLSIVSVQSAPSIAVQNVHTNGSISTNSPVIPSVASSVSSRSNVVITARPDTPTRISQNSVTPSTANPSVSPQVPIRPKSTAPVATTVVPIAPRITNLVLAPTQAGLLMAQRFGPAAAALIQNNLVARMPGVVPRMDNLGNISLPPNLAGQVHLAGAVGHPALGLSMQNMAISAEQAKQVQLHLNPAITTLTRVNPANVTAPGQVTYHLRQANPAMGTQPVSVLNGSQTSAAMIEPANANASFNMMKESVKRLKEFFHNLINLACGPGQPPEIGKMVKELVHNLMQSRVTEEEFIERLQMTLKSDPQPNLVHFLKKTLPHLRETIKKQQLQIPNSKAPASGGNVKNNNKAGGSKQLFQVTSTAAGAAVIRPHSVLSGPQLQQQLAAPHVLMAKNLDPQLFARQIPQPSRIIIASSGQVTPGIKTSMPPVAHGPAAVAAAGIPRAMIGSRNHLYAQSPALQQAVAAANLAKEKPRNVHYSSAIGGDDDINDVTCMAGVNLMEESQNILGTGAEFMGSQTRSTSDKPFLQLDRLKAKVEALAATHGVHDVSNEVLALLSHAAEQRLRTVMERLVVCSFHRVDPHKDELRYDTVSDIRSQLKVFEEIDEVERKHRESREREMLMRVAKSRSRTEDPEQARLKEKAKQLQLEEEELVRKRAANRTALEAIGGPKKKRKLDEALEQLQNSQTPGTSANASANTAVSAVPSSQNSRLRSKRITLRDLQFVIEREKKLSKSKLAYLSFLR